MNYVYFSKSRWTSSESPQSEHNCLSKLLISWLAHDWWSHYYLHIVRLMITWLRLLFVLKHVTTHDWCNTCMSTCFLTQGEPGQRGSPGAPGRIGEVGGQVCATYKLLCTLVEMMMSFRTIFWTYVCRKLEHFFRELNWSSENLKASFWRFGKLLVKTLHVLACNVFGKEFGSFAGALLLRCIKDSLGVWNTVL